MPSALPPCRYKSDKQLGELVVMQNKPPKWNEQLAAYCLNFNGRVTEASVKNFQLVADFDREHVILQFGKARGRAAALRWCWCCAGAALVLVLRWCCAGAAALRCAWPGWRMVCRGPPPSAWLPGRPAARAGPSCLRARAAGVSAEPLLLTWRAAVPLWPAAGGQERLHHGLPVADQRAAGLCDLPVVL
jgi:hypothetical protein